MSDARTIVERADGIARITFHNPGAHNALTRQMWYEMRDAARSEEHTSELQSRFL